MFKKWYNSEILSLIFIITLLIGCFMPYLNIIFENEVVFTWTAREYIGTIFLAGVIMLICLFYGYFKDKRRISAIGIFLMNLLVLVSLSWELFNYFFASDQYLREHLVFSIGFYLILISFCGLIIANLWQAIEIYKQKKSKNKSRV